MYSYIFGPVSSSIGRDASIYPRSSCGCGLSSIPVGAARDGVVSYGGGERVAIGSGLLTVLKRLVERIQKWEYVDLAELLPSQSLHDQVVDSRARFTLFPGYEIVRPKKRQVESITDSVKAFTVFPAVVATTETTRVPELLAYQLTIIKAAQSMAYNGGPTIRS